MQEEKNLRKQVDCKPNGQTGLDWESNMGLVVHSAKEVQLRYLLPQNYLVMYLILVSSI